MRISRTVMASLAAITMLEVAVVGVGCDEPEEPNASEAGDSNHVPSWIPVESPALTRYSVPKIGAERIALIERNLATKVAPKTEIIAIIDDYLHSINIGPGVDSSKIADAILNMASDTPPDKMSEADLEFYSKNIEAEIEFAVAAELCNRAYAVWATAQEKRGMDASTSTFKVMFQNAVDLDNTITIACKLSGCSAKELLDMRFRTNRNVVQDGVYGYKALSLGNSKHDVLEQLKEEKIRVDEMGDDGVTSAVNIYGYCHYFPESRMPCPAIFQRGQLVLVIFISRPYQDRYSALAEQAKINEAIKEDYKIQPRQQTINDGKFIYGDLQNAHKRMMLNVDQDSKTHNYHVYLTFAVIDDR